MAFALDDRGSSPAEFVMVGALLTLLTLGVMQLALAVYVRGVAHDAAVEGAYDAALADVTDGEGAARAREIVDRTLGPGFVQAVRTQRTAVDDAAMVQVTMRLTLPLVGLMGIPAAWEVTAHAPADDTE
ncbi:TadE/TadG family type IV pilus assembly protein [Microbacterium sp. NE2HP2]|uniref:TadE/TadG family type IV pilus assembly protein n=1 Tax=Microbacterium plantarum TaxID=1816425 RepID=UPI00236735AD|nr:TadE/TadG family type IV pilus assembly protein [Microbacterium plantarum]MDD7943532.1 TadE/TadG family type IV pilus assembly protein [Microbacterium plantarum]